MANFSFSDIYRNRLFIRWFITISSLVIALFSILSTNLLINNLKQRELKLIDLYAKSIEYAVNEASETDISFINEQIIFSNNSIPVILTNANNEPLDYRNVTIPERYEGNENEFLKREIRRMANVYKPIVINVKNENEEVFDRNYVYYKNSRLLRQLRYYPYIQLMILGIFALIAYFAFRYSKIAEQNRVWAGMAKETAHQLGTPISSLLAWKELINSGQEVSPQVMSEFGKDIERLERITERFSNIGSAPSLQVQNLASVVSEALDYLSIRLSGRIAIHYDIPASIQIPLNRALFEWVLENLVKNAVDAMGAEGAINVMAGDAGRNIYLDISDTGKGMTRGMVENIFSPGYSTKKRGWGLGLALSKRIIENYHHGKISVHSTTPGRGTTFRILLPK